MKEAIMLYPSPSFAHLVSIVELGKLILQHQPHLSIIILVPSMPSNQSNTTSLYISQTDDDGVPNISFLSLPLPSLQSSSLFESIAMNALSVVDALNTISSASIVLALVTSSLHENLNNTHIPIYFYFTSSASALAFFLYLPTFHSQTPKSFKDLSEKPLNFPGLPPLAASYAPQPVMNRDSPSYSFFLGFGTCLLKPKGLVLNTFDSLEPLAIEAIKNGTCFPNDQTPPVFCIGPLITSAKDDHDSSNCIEWLDKQPSESVVFLCFGSKGVFSEAQIKEIGIRLERSSHRFLWVVKSPLGLDTAQFGGTASTWFLRENQRERHGFEIIGTTECFYKNIKYKINSAT